jgi:predicted nucleotidyltransferase
MISRPLLTIPPHVLAEFCRQNHIRHLGLFGSVLRDDFNLDSDVDVLVEFEQGAQISLFTLADIQDRLSALLGRQVELVPRDGLKPVIRESVLAAEYVLYAA